MESRSFPFNATKRDASPNIRCRFTHATWNGDDAKKIVDNGMDESWKVEMWKINKEFIDQQMALKKEFYFSQEPWDFPTKTFRSQEAEYLIELGAKDFQKINENTWKVVW
jgi:hypothetical protein